MSHNVLTPQSGEIKGNNPYNLNRMVVDPSFRRAQGATPLSQIQGYSATGEVVFKGQQLSFAPKRDRTHLDGIKRPVGPLVAANVQSNIGTVPARQEGEEQISEPFIAHGKRARKLRRRNRLARLDQLLQKPNTDTGTDPDQGPSDWQREFSSASVEDHLNNLDQLTEARYAHILGQVDLGRY